MQGTFHKIVHLFLRVPCPWPAPSLRCSSSSWLPHQMKRSRRRSCYCWRPSAEVLAKKAKTTTTTTTIAAITVIITAADGWQVIRRCAADLLAFSLRPLSAHIINAIDEQTITSQGDRWDRRPAGRCRWPASNGGRREVVSTSTNKL